MIFKYKLKLIMADTNNKMTSSFQIFKKFINLSLWILEGKNGWDLVSNGS